MPLITGGEGGIAFGKALTANRSLVELNMRFNRIGFGLDRSINAFCEALAVNTGLRWLDLAQNELMGRSGGNAVGEALKVLRPLERPAAEPHIGGRAFCSCSCSLAPGAAVAPALLLHLRPISQAHVTNARVQVNRTLRVLNLEKNELGAEGGLPLAKALASNTALTSLSVAHNELGTAGAAFADALRASTCLCSLDLSKNEIGADEGAALGDALRTSRCKELNLKGNRIGRGAAQIAAALADNSSLVSLDVSRLRAAADRGPPPTTCA